MAFGSEKFSGLSRNGPQVISCRGKNEKSSEMYKTENCACKACKSTVFHCQICKFVTFLLPSSSCLLKLPINWTDER